MSDIAGPVAVRDVGGDATGLDQHLTIPEPDANGIIHLQNGRTYLSRRTRLPGLRGSY